MLWRGSVAVALTVLACMVAGDDSSCAYDSCSKCISAPNCIWCSAPNISMVMDNGTPFLQCVSKKSSHVDEFLNACEGKIYDPPTEMSEEPSSEKHLTPQRVKLKMRAGESTRITLKYEHQVNYPMDLYFLMDGSKSMSDLKTNLSSVTNELVDGLTEITTNIKLGFGMFVDKPVLPYTDMNSWNTSTCKNCAETFSFKNILPLTTNQNTFQDKVLSTPSSKNTDIPEGTLDALMQVASCMTDVGWREDALKVVVVFTDADYHLAGDGKFAGIVEPNDMKCHLDGEGQYTHSKWQDYPSVGELRRVLKNNDVSTTFAVKRDYLAPYQLLAEQLYRSSCVEMDKHSDIVNVIVEPIEDIIGSVTMSPKETIKEVSVKVSSRCKGGAEQDENTCKGMRSGDTAEFFLDIELKECPRDKNHTTINFVLDGQSQTFVLDLKMLCQCSCDSVDDEEFIANAAACTNQGDLRCGACDCYEDFLGKKCQCQKGSEDGSDIDGENCIDPNEKEAGPCSGQGKCVCGQCECNKRPDKYEVISGTYCQCTNYHKDCRGNNGEICSGNGKCNCNVCECTAGWGGQACSCRNSTENCRASDGKVCSDHGDCICNKCVCENDYEGKHCENCKLCDAKCEDHKSCIECLVFETGMYAGTACEDTCSNYKVTLIPDMTKGDGYTCSSIDGDDCRFMYQFKDNGTNILVWAQDQKECPTEINPLIIVGGVLASVVLVGLLLLIAWKVITNIKDKREYAAFLVHQKTAIWNDNVSPLYKPATTKVANPLFEGASAD